MSFTDGNWLPFAVTRLAQAMEDRGPILMQHDFLVFIAMSSQESSLSHNVRSACNCETDGANSNLSSAYKTMAYC